MNEWIGFSLVVLLFAALVLALSRLEKTSLRCLDLEAENFRLNQELEARRCPFCEVRESRGHFVLQPIVTPVYYESGKD